MTRLSTQFICHNDVRLDVAKISLRIRELTFSVCPRKTNESSSLREPSFSFVFIPYSGCLHWKIKHRGSDTDFSLFVAKKTSFFLVLQHILFISSVNTLRLSFRAFSVLSGFWRLFVKLFIFWIAYHTIAQFYWCNFWCNRNGLQTWTVCWSHSAKTSVTLKSNIYIVGHGVKTDNVLLRKIKNTEK